MSAEPRLVHIRGGPRDGECLEVRHDAPYVVSFALPPPISMLRLLEEEADEPVAVMPEVIMLPIQRDPFSGRLWVQWPESEPEDILTRIDQTIEAWERGPDAMRWQP